MHRLLPLFPLCIVALLATLVHPATAAAPLFTDLFGCDRVNPKLPDGRRGWLLRRNDSALPVFVPTGNATCASPVGALDLLSSRDRRSADLVQRVASGTAPTTGGRRVTISGQAGRSRDWMIEGESYTPLSDGGGGIPSVSTSGRVRSLRWATQVDDLLTVYRNSIMARADRRTLRFDVLAVSRLTLGMCLSPSCDATVAVDVVRGGEFGPTAGTVTVLVYTDADGGVAPVEMDDGGMLSLGRGIWEQPERLGGEDGPWSMRGFSASTEWTVGRPGHSEGLSGISTDVNSVKVRSDLRDLLCSHPAGSFLTAGSRDCRGHPGLDFESKPCNVGPKSYLRNVAQRGANVSQY